MVRESSVTEPSVVMRNMRQVMNGLKNYTGQLPITTNKVLREFFLTVCLFFSELWRGRGGATDPEGEGESAA